MKNVLENLSHIEKIERLVQCECNLRTKGFITAADLKIDQELDESTDLDLCKFFIMQLKDEIKWLENYVENIDLAEAVCSGIEDDDPDEALTKMWLLNGSWKDHPLYKSINTPESLITY